MTRAEYRWRSEAHQAIKNAEWVGGKSQVTPCPIGSNRSGYRHMRPRGAGPSNIFQAVLWFGALGSPKGVVRSELLRAASLAAMGSLDVPGGKNCGGLVQTGGRAFRSDVSCPPGEFSNSRHGPTTDDRKPSEGRGYRARRG